VLHPGETVAAYNVTEHVEAQLTYTIGHIMEYVDAGATCGPESTLTTGAIDVNVNQPGHYKIEYTCTNDCGDKLIVDRDVHMQCPKPTLSIDAYSAAALTIDVGDYAFARPEAMCVNTAGYGTHPARLLHAIDVNTPGSYNTSFQCTNTCNGARSTFQGPSMQVEVVSVPCVHSMWTGFSACSKSCGEGIMTRTRSIVRQPIANGTACQALEYNRTCNRHACPVDCDAADTWGDWSPCSAKCGGGNKYRMKSIITMPSFGGKNCPSITQSQTCNTHTCGEFAWCTKVKCHVASPFTRHIKTEHSRLEDTGSQHLCKFNYAANGGAGACQCQCKCKWVANANATMTCE